MKKNIELGDLGPFLQDFNERHEARPLTLRVLEGTIPMTEGESLPLIGLDLDDKGENAPRIEILLGDEDSDGKRHLSHTVSNVQRVTVEMEHGNREKRLVLESQSGAQAILTFD